MDGVEFLVLQAAASFEWWLGRPAPIEVMVAAAKNA
jgi:shikimate 5-dehydrogenase